MLCNLLTSHVISHLIKYLHEFYMSSARSVISWTAAPLLRSGRCIFEFRAFWIEQRLHKTLTVEDLLLAQRIAWRVLAQDKRMFFCAMQLHDMMQHASNARNQQTFNGKRAKLEVTYLVDSLFMMFPSQSSFAGTSHNPVFFYGLQDRDSAVSFSHKAMGLCHASYNSTQFYTMILDQFSNALWVCQGWQMQVLRFLGRLECGWPHLTVKTQQVTVSRKN